MREAIRQALLADATVAALVDDRVYTKAGPFGGISRTETPAAFDADDDMLLSLVVTLEARARLQSADVSATTVVAVQPFQVWALCAPSVGYDGIREVLAAVRRRLHNAAKRGIGLTPVEESQITWRDIFWTATGPEAIDESLNALAIFCRFDAIIVEQIV